MVTSTAGDVNVRITLDDAVPDFGGAPPGPPGGGRMPTAGPSGGTPPQIMRMFAEQAAKEDPVQGGLIGGLKGGVGAISPEQKEQLVVLKQSQAIQKEALEYQKFFTADGDKKSGLLQNIGTGIKQSGALQKVAGSGAGKAAASMLGGLGKLAGPLGMIAGATGGMLLKTKTMSAGIGGLMTIIQAIFDVFMAPLAPIIAKGLQSLSKVVVWLQGFMKDPMGYIRNMITKIGEWFGELPPKIEKWWNDLVDTILGYFGPFEGIVRKILGYFTGIMSAWIGLFTGVASTWINFFKNTAGDWIALFLGILGEWLKFFTGIKDAFLGLFSGILEAWLGFFSGIKDAFMLLWDGIKDLFLGNFSGALEGFLGFFTGIAKSFIGLFGDLGATWLAFFVDIASSWIGLFKGIAGQWVDFFKNTASDWIGLFTGILSSWLGFFGDIATNFLDLFGDPGKKVVAFFKDAPGDIVEFFKTAPGKVVEFFKTAPGKIVDFFAGVPGKIGTMFMSIVKGYIGLYKVIFDVISEVWNQVGKLAKNLFDWMLYYFKLGLDNIPMIKNVIDTPVKPKTIADQIVGGIDAIRSVGEQSFQENVINVFLGEDLSNKERITVNTNRDVYSDDKSISNRFFSALGWR